MSHNAMNWALSQKHVQPAAWIVLIQLADRHNKDTLRVDPDQDLIAADCNMSRRSINRHLADLEEMGLLLRVQRVNPATKRQLPTFYILGLDFDNPPYVENAVCQIDTRISEVRKGNITASVCQSDTRKPCANFGQSRVPISAKAVCQFGTLSNPVKEPLREPCANAHSSFGLDDLVSRFLRAYPRKSRTDLVRAELQAAIAAGADPEALIAAAAEYAGEQKGNAARFIALGDNWLKAGGWRRFAVSVDGSLGGGAVAATGPCGVVVLASEVSGLAALADMLGRNWKRPLSEVISPINARKIIAAGLATREKLADCGVGV